MGGWPHAEPRTLLNRDKCSRRWQTWALVRLYELRHFPRPSLSFSICKMILLNQRISQTFSSSQKLQSVSQTEQKLAKVTEKRKILMA